MTQPRLPEGYINARRLSDVGMRKEVFAAFSVVDKSWYVLKCFRESPSERAVREDLRPHLSKLAHNHIVRQYPPVLHEGTIWVIEELLDGTFQDLAPIDNQHQFATLAAQIAKALDYLHTGGGNSSDLPIVHADIHLNNCGVSGGVAKLIDFGQATYEDENQPRTAGRGYICTRAPEQFEPSPSAKTSLDIWAYGCTLYAFRTGEYPFIEAAEVQQYRLQRAAEEPEAVDQIHNTVLRRMSEGMDGFPQRHRQEFDDELWSILSDMIVFEPSRRLTADKVLERLQGYVTTAQDRMTRLEPTPESRAKLANEQLKSVEEGKSYRLDWFVQALKEDVRGVPVISDS